MNAGEWATVVIVVLALIGFAFEAGMAFEQYRVRQERERLEGGAWRKLSPAARAEHLKRLLEQWEAEDEAIAEEWDRTCGC